MRMIESKILHKIDEFVFQLVPAYAIDFASKLVGKKQKYADLEYVKYFFLIFFCF